MKRNIKKTIKKAVVAVAAASMLTVLTAPLAVMPVSAATVTRGSYDFSNMVVRRVWFNTDDPVFLIDDYQRVWLDSNVNVLATGNATDPKPDTSSLMAPMKNMFAYIGADYKEDGDKITVSMNNTTVKLTIGSPSSQLTLSKLSSLDKRLTNPSILSWFNSGRCTANPILASWFRFFWTSPA